MIKNQKDIPSINLTNIRINIMINIYYNTHIQYIKINRGGYLCLKN